MVGLLRLSTTTLVCRECFSTLDIPEAETPYFFEGLPLTGNPEEYVDLLKSPKEEKPEGADEEACLMYIKSWVGDHCNPKEARCGRKIARWQTATVGFIIWMTLESKWITGYLMNICVPVYRLLSLSFNVFIKKTIHFCRKPSSQGCSRGRGRDGRRGVQAPRLKQAGHPKLMLHLWV